MDTFRRQRKTRQVGRSKRPAPGTIAKIIWDLIDKQRSSQTGDIRSAEIYATTDIMGIPRETARSNIKRYKKQHRID
jgi:hypothetical protein